MSDSNSDSNKQNLVIDSDSIKKETSLGSDPVETFEDYIDTSTRWWSVPHLRLLNFGIFLVTLSSTNNGYDGSMLNGLQSLPIWHEKMGDPTGYVLGHLSNGTIYGSLVSVLIAPYISDIFGRRAGIVVGQTLNLIGSILQGASTNYGFFLASRIVMGLGTGISTVASPTLVSEVSYPSLRGPCTAFYNTCWYLGAVIAAWVTYGTRTIDDDYCWRIPSYLQGAIPFIQIITIFFVPESPRYYISKGKYDKAEKMLRKYHIGYSTNERDVGLVQFEMKEIETAIELEKIQTQTSYLDFIKLKNFRKRLFLVLYTPCLMQLSGNGLVSYYLNKVLNSIGITSSTKQLQINGCLMIYNMVLAMSAAFIIKYFRRRTIFLSSIAGMLVCYILWTILSALAVKNDYPTSLSNGVLAFIFLYYAAYDLGMNGLPILYVTEILPYTHRAKGVNLFALGQTCTLIFNGYVNPIGMDAIDWKYYIVWCSNLAAELVIVYFFYPETSGRSLEEVAEVFGDDFGKTIYLPNQAKAVLETDGKVKTEHQEEV